MPENGRLTELEDDIANIIQAFDRAWQAAQAEQSESLAVAQTQQSLDNGKVKLLHKKMRMQRLKHADEVLTSVLHDNSLLIASKKVFGAIGNQINEAFSRIHSPRQYEFSLSEKTLLVSRDTKTPWSLNQVSTGQRAAFALSIFLALNSTASSAPPVILIDDPVAYVDDLNVLSFLDYLRSIVLQSRRQIFFATADTKVAALFEKKFSFLGGQRYRKLSLLPSG